MSTTAVVPAPAAEAAETPEVSVQERLDKSSAADLKDWRLTGKIPEPRKADSATATEPEVKPLPADSATAKPSETAAAPEAAKPQKKRDAEGRVKQLLDRVQELERQVSQATPREVKQEPRPATETTARPPKPQAVDKDAETGELLFKTWQDLQAAQEKWLLDEADYRAEQRITKTAKEQQAAQTEKLIREAQQKKVVESRKKFADFDAVALNPDLPIPPNSPVDLYVIRSDRGMEVLYELGKNNGAELARIAKLDPLSQVIELHAMELKLTEPSSAQRETPQKLPPPARELGARSAAPADEADSALARGDTAGYMRAMNARELKARRG